MLFETTRSGPSPKYPKMGSFEGYHFRGLFWTPNLTPVLAPQITSGPEWSLLALNRQGLHVKGGPILGHILTPFGTSVGTPFWTYFGSISPPSGVVHMWCKYGPDGPLNQYAHIG